MQVRGDRVRLGQVVDNLVANALEFTQPGGRVDVAAERHDGVVRIAVADTGRASSSSEMPRPVSATASPRRSWRASSTASSAPSRPSATRSPAPALGLASASAIVEGHGGRIDVESTPGAGTTFAIELPA